MRVQYAHSARKRRFEENTMKLTAIIKPELYSILEEMAEQSGKSVNSVASLIIADYFRLALLSDAKSLNLEEAAAIVGNDDLNALEMSEVKIIELEKVAWRYVSEFASTANATISKMTNLVIADYLRRTATAGVKSISIDEAQLELNRGAHLPAVANVKEFEE